MGSPPTEWRVMKSSLVLHWGKEVLKAVSKQNLVLDAVFLLRPPAAMPNFSTPLSCRQINREMCKRGRSSYSDQNRIYSAVTAIS